MRGRGGTRGRTQARLRVKGAKFRNMSRVRARTFSLVVVALGLVDTHLLSNSVILLAERIKEVGDAGSSSHHLS